MINHPISIYIHFPWCIKKCYYCDFNSYSLNINNKICEAEYIAKIIKDFDNSLNFIPDLAARRLISIFLGGGTPSLLSGKAIAELLNHVNKKFDFSKDLEITLEVNPGTIEQDNIYNYKLAGINRISVGVQSFQTDKLIKLGRIHTPQEIKYTLNQLRDSQLSNFNIDLMYGLPDQNLADVLYDLEMALSFKPPHVSWYQLTLEPNTFFYNKPPPIPTHEAIWEMYQYGLEVLNKSNYINYEISGFAKDNFYCHHNLNYWKYGDYLGVGPGAHSKITAFELINNEVRILNIKRLVKIKNPKTYFASLSDENNNNIRTTSHQILNKKDIIFEFMLNSLRLKQGFLLKEFIASTGYCLDDIKDPLKIAVSKGLLTISYNEFGIASIQPTVMGSNFLNDLQELFL